jgi:hypothetical protein
MVEIIDPWEVPNSGKEMNDFFPGVFTKYPSTRKLRIKLKNLWSAILFLSIDIRIS